MVYRPCLWQVSRSEQSWERAELTSEHMALQVLRMQVGFVAVWTRKFSVGVFGRDGRVSGRSVCVFGRDGSSSGRTWQYASSSL
jgi:hypothetical protein